MAIIQTLDGGNIPSDRYVDITSGVGGASALSTRQLILRLMTTNNLFPTESVVTFTSASEISDYLNGDTSLPEYKQALFYFSYVSKSIRQPQSISFGRWADTPTAAQCLGAEVATLTKLQTYTAEELTVTLDGAEYIATAIDFSAAASLADVAAALQAKIQPLDASLSAATVVYNATSKGFDFSTNAAADGSITFSSTNAAFLSDIGWNSLAIFSKGVAAESLTQTLNNTIDISNDFLSFDFIDSLDLTEKTEVGTWINGQNFKFMYCTKNTKSEAQAVFDALGGFGGIAATIENESNAEEYPWLLPAAISGAINPSDPNAFPNYMFSPESTLTAVITTESEANQFDAIRMNYMGRTQEAGTQLTWYQRGVLFGGDTDALTMSVYVGEAWLKSDVKSSFLNAFNALPSITPDNSGKAILEGYLDSSIARALNNGVILVGKTLTDTQKAYITQVTGDSNAYQNVQNEGYWKFISFEEVIQPSGVPEQQAVYTLVYAKGDKVRKISGRHILI